MSTLGEVLLHEYTHGPDIVQPPLRERTEDIAYSFYRSRVLARTEPGRAPHNADSYASFATELTWTVLCGRDFDPPNQKCD